MLDTYKPNTEDMQGHLRVHTDFQEVMKQHSLSIKFYFEADFKVVIPKRDAWDYIPADQEAMVIYTEEKREWEFMDPL
jgi:hypothetical protein